MDALSHRESTVYSKKLIEQLVELNYFCALAPLVIPYFLHITPGEQVNTSEDVDK